MSEVQIEVLLVLTAETKAVTQVADVPGGDRIVFDVVRGAFEGPHLQGRLLPSGGDWITRVANRSRTNVRLVLETHDGTTILLQYQGKAHQRDGQLRLEVVGSFDAPAGPYEWLNDVQTFGLGMLAPEGVRYTFYRFK